MKHFLIILFLISCSATIFAQVNTVADSLYFIQTGKHLSQKDTSDNFFYKPISQGVYFYKPFRINNDFSQTNATQLIADTNRQVGFLQFSYLNEKGGLHTSQQAYKNQTADLYTEGFATLGRVKLSGNFRFNKFWEDSLANNLGTPKNGISPYYYFTPKAGTYEGQNYSMSATVVDNLLKDKLYIGLKTDYFYHWITGSVDPRLDDKNLRIKFRPSITYRKRNTFIGIEYLIGYGNETMNISYKSDIYNQSTLYPERFYYLNMGYGDIALKYNVVKQRSTNNQGIGLHFSSLLKTFNIRANFAYQKETVNNKQQFDTARISDFFSRWKLNHYSANILIEKNTQTAMQQLSLNAHLLKGKDFNTLYNGSNYFATKNDMSFKYDYLNKSEENIQWQYGVFAQYSEAHQEDILASHDIRYGILQPGISGTVYMESKNKNRINIELQPSFFLPLKNKISVPSTQINVFTQTISYPDFYYRSGRFFSGNAEFNFMTPHLIYGIYSGFFVKGNYFKKLSVRYFQEIPQEDNTRESRFSIQFGFTMYL